MPGRSCCLCLLLILLLLGSFIEDVLRGKRAGSILADLHIAQSDTALVFYAAQPFDKTLTIIIIIINIISPSVSVSSRPVIHNWNLVIGSREVVCQPVRRQRRRLVIIIIIIV